MANWQIYVTWGILILIGFAVSGLSKQVERFREEFQEVRELIRPEEDNEPELSPEDAAKAGSFWRG
jgi:hypothetical protein